MTKVIDFVDNFTSNTALIVVPEISSSGDITSTGDLTAVNLVGSGNISSSAGSISVTGNISSSAGNVSGVDFSGEDFTATGNLIVAGTTTTLNSTDLLIRDKDIILGGGVSAVLAATFPIVTGTTATITTAAVHNLLDTDKIYVDVVTADSGTPSEVAAFVSKQIYDVDSISNTTTFTITVSGTTASAGTINYVGPVTDVIADSAGFVIPGTTLHSILYKNTGNKWEFTNDIDVSGAIIASGKISIGTDVDGGGTLRLRATNSGNDLYEINATDHRWYIDTSGAVEEMRLAPSGLSVLADIQAFGIGISSDIRLKENIQTIENPLEKVNLLRGVTFDWKGSRKSSVGLIADEVELYFPELVKENSITGYKTLEYDKLIGLLIEAVKEQQKQIEELKKQITK